MKAAVLYETGKPLVVEEGIIIPDLQTGQVLVQIAYSGICRSQLMETRGKRGNDPYLPHLLGHEASGIVLETGKDVSKVKKNGRVILTWMKGEGLDCGGAKFRKGDTIINAGGVTTFSNLTIACENRCIKLPDGVPMDLAPLLGCALPTGAGIVMNTIKPEKENSLAVFGCGGIGLSAIMLANVFECQTIVAVDIEDHKLDKAKELGATHTINSSHGNPVEKIQKITVGRGVDFSIEAAGRASVIESAFMSVRDKGGLCVIAGHPANNERIQIDPFELIKGKQIQGSWGGECQPEQDIPLLAKYYLEGKLPMEKLISHKYRLEEINEGLDALETNSANRILIQMDEINL